MITDPYQQCPVFQFSHFALQLVQFDDGHDLLTCYADPLAAPIFNSGNCTSDFFYHSLEEMQKCIAF